MFQPLLITGKKFDLMFGLQDSGLSAPPEDWPSMLKDIANYQRATFSVLNSIRELVAQENEPTIKLYASMITGGAFEENDMLIGYIQYSDPSKIDILETIETLVNMQHTDVKLGGRTNRRPPSALSYEFKLADFHCP